MKSLSSLELMRECEDYWRLFDEADPNAGRWTSDRYARYVLAMTELAGRGPEIRDWCRGLLVHPNYDARDAGAFLLGCLGRRGQLGDARAAVVAELGALTRRPVEEDNKEAQAIDAAIEALADIGDPAAIPILRAVLFSDE